LTQSAKKAREKRMEYKLIKKFEEQTSTAIKTNKPNELKI
jgi:hypothetical protein